MTVAEATRLVQLRIRELAGEEEASQARELVAYVLGLDARALILHHGVELNGEQLVKLGELADRRAAGEPLQYILGEWSFMGLPFQVNEHVLIPRQDTETLCEAAVKAVRARGYQTALDLCCGSGCIGIAIRVLTGASVVCSDISESAAQVARDNAAGNDAAVDVRTGDLFSTLHAGERFDLIAVNPPYLSDEDMRHLQPELGYEPRVALYGGADGLDFYRRIAAEYRAHLTPSGLLLMEIGSTQAEAVAAMFPNASLTRDYADNPRVIAVEAEQND